MRNAADGVDWATTRTLVCAYQMIMPGEMAPSHRHPSNALRIILEGEGAFSVVDGVKMPMNAGDVVLTPGGMFHGHGHEGDQPSYWLDCLDLPLTHLRSEEHTSELQSLMRISHAVFCLKKKT